MLQQAAPVLVTLLVWWLSTGVILYLDGLPPRTFRWSLSGATALFALALYGIAATRDDTSLAGAYLAFGCGVVAWGWQEMAFLMGVVTGPRRTPCPLGSRGWRRAGHAFAAILYHELALVAVAATLWLMTANAPNRLGAWTFLLLWGMRLSAKLNVFLGVRNLYEEFLPTHLRYLHSYFRRRPMNALFPFSMAAAAAVTWLLWQRAWTAPGGGFEATSHALLASMASLALLEHAFLVLPVSSSALWRWGMHAPATASEAAVGSAPCPR